MVLEEGRTISDAAETLQLDRKTVAKYCKLPTFAPKSIQAPRKRQPRTCKLDQYKEFIDEILKSDSVAPKKQRHTITRITNRLIEEYGFKLSKETVRRYVTERKREMGTKKEDGFIPIIHKPGSAQADFGTADIIIDDMKITKAKYLVLSFPYSNAAFCQVCYGENLECLLESLVAIFEHIGGVPSVIWFDNASAIVQEIKPYGERDVTDRFEAFRQYYKFDAVYMNPYAGHEKGHVENKVGTIRRNFLVPIPSYATLKEANEAMLEKSEKYIADTFHYKKHIPVRVLYEGDCAAFLPLPAERFHTERWETVVTDKMGFFKVDGGKYTYSSSPYAKNQSVNVEMTAETVTVFTLGMEMLAQHKRLYAEHGTSIDWSAYIVLISRKPRSLLNTGLAGLLPVDMREHLLTCDLAERYLFLRLLAALTRRKGLEEAISTIQSKSQGVYSFEILHKIYSQLFPKELDAMIFDEEEQEAMADIDEPETLPDMDEQLTEDDLDPVESTTDLKELDKLLEGGDDNG